jgi:hypothetical protein
MDKKEENNFAKCKPPYIEISHRECIFKCKKKQYIQAPDCKKKMNEE